MKVILCVFSFFLFFSSSCAEKFTAKDRSNEKINCRPGERKEIKKEKFICVRVDGICYCNYSYKCVQDSEECKEFNRYHDGRPCPLNAQCAWISDCDWIIRKCDPDIKECNTANLEKLFGKCWCRPWIFEQDFCFGEEIDQTVWIKVD